KPRATGDSDVRVACQPGEVLPQRRLATAGRTDQDEAGNGRRRIAGSASRLDSEYLFEPLPHQLLTLFAARFFLPAQQRFVEGMRSRIGRVLAISRAFRVTRASGTRPGLKGQVLLRVQLPEERQRLIVFSSRDSTPQDLEVATLGAFEIPHRCPCAVLLVK